MLSWVCFLREHSKMDFSCRWWEKGGAIMYEDCMASNQKKELNLEQQPKTTFCKAICIVSP